MKAALSILALVIVFVLGVCVGQLPTWVERMAGRNYEPSSSKDAILLRRIVYGVTPLVAAIRTFQATNHRAPTPAELLEGGLLPPKFKETWFDGLPRVRYLGDGKDMDFTVYIKLSWDASLQLDASDEHWHFNPGTGVEGVDLDE